MGILATGGRWVRTYIQDAPAYSVQAARALAIMTNTTSPSQTGAQGPNNYGLPGTGSFEGTKVSPTPLQQFVGIASPINRPPSNFGDLLAGSLPGTAAPQPAGSSTDGALMWMSYGQLGGLGYGS